MHHGASHSVKTVLGFTVVLQNDGPHKRDRHIDKTLSQIDIKTSKHISIYY